MEQEREVQQEAMEIDLQEILRVLGKWKTMIVLITLFGILVAGILSFFILPPVYEAQTTLLVVQGEQKNTASKAQPDNLESMISDISRLPEMTIKTYVEQLKNPVLLGEVIKKLDLTTQNYSYTSLGGMITATSIKDTNLIKVTVQNTDPQLAIAIGDTLTELFLESISKNNQQQMSKSVQFLQEQAAKVSQELVQQRSLLKEYDSRPGSLTYLQQQQDSYMSDLNKYRSSYQEATIAYQQLHTGLGELERQLAQTPQTLVSGQDNPLYLSLKEKIALKTTEMAERDSQMKTTGNYISELEKKLNTLQVEVTDKKGEGELIQGKVAELEKTYQLLTEKITQTQISQSVNLGDTSLLVVSPSTASDSPIKPNKKLNIAIAALLGLIFSVAMAFVLEMLDNKINTKKDVEKYLKLPVLGEIPVFNEADGADKSRGKDYRHGRKKKFTDAADYLSKR